MGTALALIEKDDYALATSDGIRATLESFKDAGIKLSEQNLPRIEVPSGAIPKWVVVDASGEAKMVDELVGIPLSLESRGFLWPYTDPGQYSPVLVTHDMVHAYRKGDVLGDIDPKALESMKVIEDGHEYYDWLSPAEGGTNPYTAWGSAPTGRGKRAKETKRLLLYRTGEVLPSVISIPATSFRNFALLLVDFLRFQLFLWHAEIALKLIPSRSDDGQDYFRIMPRVSRAVPKDYWEFIDKLREQFKSGDPATSPYVPETNRTERASGAPADHNYGPDPAGLDSEGPDGIPF